MLKVIYDRTSPSSKDIADEMKISRFLVNVMGNALCSRGLTRKKVEAKPDSIYPGLIRKKSIWTLRDQKREKVIGMLQEAYGI